MIWIRALTVIICLCGTGPLLADVFVRDDIITEPTPSAFSVCYNHTCKEVVQRAFSEQQWQSITRLFRPTATSARDERNRIARAISQMEQMVGQMTNTSNDRGANMQGLSATGNQLDCIDESTNTTTYLRMMQQAGLLRWHRVVDRVTRGFFLFGWPHTTAVIAEVKSSSRWVVDSWFHDNGVAPEIVPLAQWKKGWEPQPR